MELKFADGQQVKVLKHTEESNYWADGYTVEKVGQEGTVTEIDNHDDGMPYFVEFEDGDGIWFPEEVLEAAEPKKWEPKFKVGDKIDYWLGGGPIPAWNGSTVIEVGSTTPGYEESYRVDHPEMGVGTMTEHQMRPHETSEPESIIGTYRRITEEDTHRFSVGQIVRVVYVSTEGGLPWLATTKDIPAWEFPQTEEEAYGIWEGGVTAWISEAQSEPYDFTLPETVQPALTSDDLGTQGGLLVQDGEVIGTYDKVEKSIDGFSTTFKIGVGEVKDPAAPTVEELSHIHDMSDFFSSFSFSIADTEAESDAVEHPAHYSAGMPEGIEVRDIIKAQGFWKEFCMGNVVKYSLRWQYKNGIEDLRKLRQYTDWLIEELEA